MAAPPRPAQPWLAPSPHHTQDYGTIPKNAWELGVDNFRRELRALRRAVRFNELAAVEGEAGEAMAGPVYRAGFAAARGIFGCGPCCRQCCRRCRCLSRAPDAVAAGGSRSGEAQTGCLVFAPPAIVHDETAALELWLQHLASKGRPGWLHHTPTHPLSAVLLPSWMCGWRRGTCSTSSQRRR